MSDPFERKSHEPVKEFLIGVGAGIGIDMLFPEPDANTLKNALVDSLLVTICLGRWGTDNLHDRIQSNAATYVGAMTGQFIYTSARYYLGF